MTDRLSLMGQALALKTSVEQAQRLKGLDRLLAARKGVAQLRQLQRDAGVAETQGLRITRTRLKQVESTLEALVRKGLVETAKLLSELLEGLPEHDQLRSAAAQFLQILVSRHPPGGEDIKIA